MNKREQKYLEYSDEGENLNDLAKIYNCNKDEISIGLITEENLEELKGKKVHYGDINLKRLTRDESLTLPHTIEGNIWLNNLIEVESLTLPHIIGGNIWLSNLTRAESLTLGQIIEGHLYLNSLTSTEGLKLPKGFDLSKLIVSNKVKSEINANPELYYQTEELEEEKENEQGRTR